MRSGITRRRTLLFVGYAHWCRRTLLGLQRCVLFISSVLLVRRGMCPFCLLNTQSTESALVLQLDHPLEPTLAGAQSDVSDSANGLQAARRGWLGCAGCDFPSCDSRTFGGPLWCLKDYLRPSNVDYHHRFWLSFTHLTLSRSIKPVLALSQQSSFFTVIRNFLFALLPCLSLARLLHLDSLLVV